MSSLRRAVDLGEVRPSISGPTFGAEGNRDGKEDSFGWAVGVEVEAVAEAAWSMKGRVFAGFGGSTGVTPGRESIMRSEEPSSDRSARMVSQRTGSYSGLLPF